MTIRLMTCCIIVAVLDLGAAFGADVEGTIALPGGGAPVLAVVMLSQGDSVTVSPADEDGKYKFSDVEPGTYALVANGGLPDGRQGFYQKNELIVGSQSTVLNFTLNLDPLAPSE